MKRRVAHVKRFRRFCKTFSSSAVAKDTIEDAVNSPSTLKVRCFYYRNLSCILIYRFAHLHMVLNDTCHRARSTCVQWATPWWGKSRTLFCVFHNWLLLFLSLPATRKNRVHVYTCICTCTGLNMNQSHAATWNTIAVASNSDTRFVQSSHLDKIQIWLISVEITGVLLY